MQHKLVPIATLLLLSAGLVHASPGEAARSVAQSASGVAVKAENGVKKGARAADDGVRRGVGAANRAADKVGGKLGLPPGSPPPKPAVPPG